MANRVVVAHPHKRERADELWESTLTQLAAVADVREIVMTRGSADDGRQIAAAIERCRPDAVVAAGGDGTVATVVHALCARAPEATPALAILALGTANNFARTLGLPSYRQSGAAAVAAAVAAIAGGHRRRVDVGRAGARCFIGSLALGLDAEILALRNRLRRRLRLRDPLAGYPLYLWSCAVSVLRQRAVPAQLVADGRELSGPLFNLLVTNAPLYAGEFRFDAQERLDDARLEVQLFAGRGDYLRAYAAAWRRHVHHQAGRAVAPPPDLLRVRELSVSLPAAVAVQIDGELGAATTALTVDLLPGRLEVCAPPAVVAGGAHR